MKLPQLKFQECSVILFPFIIFIVDCIKKNIYFFNLSFFLMIERNLLIKIQSKKKCCVRRVELLCVGPLYSTVSSSSKPYLGLSVNLMGLPTLFTLSSYSAGIPRKIPVILHIFSGTFPEFQEHFTSYLETCKKGR